jgi:hypothetical protein
MIATSIGELFFQQLPNLKKRSSQLMTLELKILTIKHRRKNILSGYSAGGEVSNTFLNFLSKVYYNNILRNIKLKE